MAEEPKKTEDSQDAPAAPSPEGEAHPAPAPPMLEVLFEEHKKSILIGAIAIVVLVFGWVFASHRAEARQTAAAMAFSSASSIADYEAVIKEHGGTPAAGNALLMKADLELKANKLNESQATLTSFVSAYPDHPLYYQGIFALGGQAHQKGNLEEAEKYFQQIIDAAESVDLAPLAVIRKGDIAYERGNYEAARSLYQSVTPTYPGTPFTYEADQKLRREKLLPPKPKPAPVAPAVTPTPAPAPAPAPAPKAATPKPASAPKASAPKAGAKKGDAKKAGAKKGAKKATAKPKANASAPAPQAAPNKPATKPAAAAPKATPAAKEKPAATKPAPKAKVAP